MTLKEALKKAKISQSELAQRLGVARQQVSQWAAGTYAPRMETQRKIDSILQERIEY